MNLQNIIKEGEREFDRKFLSEVTPNSDLWIQHRDAIKKVKSLLSSRTTEAYRAGLERARGIVEQYLKHSTHNPNDTCLEDIIKEIKSV